MLDGAVLVMSAVEGVQAQTRVLMRTLRRLRLPTLIFVNKIDRVGAQRDTLLRSISRRLASAIVPMGRTSGSGHPAASYRPYGPADAGFTAGLVDLLTDRDDALLDRLRQRRCGVLPAIAPRPRVPDRPGAGSPGVLRLRASPARVSTQ